MADESLFVAVEDELSDKQIPQPSKGQTRIYLPATALATNFHNVHGIENDSSSSSDDELSLEHQELQTNKQLQTIYCPKFQVENEEEDPQIHQDSDLENEDDEVEIEKDGFFEGVD